MNKLLTLIFFLFNYFHFIHAYTSVSPIWLTSSYMRAGSRDVIASLTGASEDPTYIFTFSSPLPGVPNLAYGIRRYRGADTIRQETFEIRKLSLNASSFKVQVDIVGSTNIYTLNVPYLAVDPTFPHHLNSFDNIPVNYGQTLTNITVKSMSQTRYYNQINYTQQASGRAYTTFAQPLSSNKILLYITSLSIQATGWDIIWGYYPVDLNINYSILTTNTYSLSVSLSLYVSVAKLQFSMIVFNADDVQSSKKYVIVYQVWETNSNGGFIRIPIEFVDNFILGLTDFSTVDGKCVITYQWSFANISGNYGVQLVESVPSNGAYDCAFSRMKSTMFYMKTWQCSAANPYFNLTTNLCQDSCGLYYYANTTLYQCFNCQFGCNQCLNGTVCTGCDGSIDHRVLTNVSGKSSCVCMPRYYQDPSNNSNKVCLACISNCLTCSNSTSCQVCNQLSGYILTTDKKCKLCGYGCLSCDESPYFCHICKAGLQYDPISKKCVCLAGTFPSTTSVNCLACSPTCKTCTGPSQSECTSCIQTSIQPYYNSTTNKCQTQCGFYYFQNIQLMVCSICPTGCTDCSNAATCISCDLETDHRSLVAINNTMSCPCIQGYYQDLANLNSNVCLKCTIANCVACSDATVCTLCNQLPGYTLTSSKSCLLCGYGCATCNSRTSSCTSCKVGFQLNALFKCDCLPGTYASTTSVTCVNCHQKCKTCTGPLQTQCTSCISNSSFPYYNATTTSCQSGCGLYYFENKTIYECQQCHFNCKDCDTSPQCTQCDLENNFRKLITQRGRKNCPCMTGYYQDPLNSQNKICKKCISNCITCKNAITCEVCNQSNGFILSVQKKCIQCGVGCSSCSQITLECQACTNQFVYDQASKQCTCPIGTVKAVGSVACTSCDSTCKTCSGPSQYECTSCSDQQHRVPLKQSNNLIQCICDSFTYVESSQSRNCVKKSNQSCEYGFIYMKEKKNCVEVCGDGKNFGMFQCDDGNQADGDGCSKKCQIQQDFDCKTVNGSQSCIYVGIVNIVSAKSFKYPFSNTILIQCQLNPIKNFFYSLDWKSGLVLIGPKMQIIDAWMQGIWLNINTTYFEDLTGKTLTIKYSSAITKNKTNVKSSRQLFDSVFDFDITLRDYELPIAPINNIKPSYLEDNTYSTVKKIQSSLFITATCIIVLILLSFTLKSVFPFWQLLFTLQLLFLSLGVINNMNPILTGLTEFSIIKGLRSTKIYFESLQSLNIIFDYNIASLGYVSSFFGNMNIMIFIQITVILTTCALFLMSKKDLAMQFSFQFCKRILMLLILFSGLNYTFSIGLIASTYPFQITVAAITGVILLGQLYNFLRNMGEYYYFNKIFDLSNRKIKIIIGGLILIRMCQAILISSLRKQTYTSSKVILILQFLLAISMTLFRPYIKTIYNVLSILSQWIATIFLAINLIFNLQIVTQIQTQNILSLVQVSLNYIIALLMIICFGYSLYKDYCVKEMNLTPLQFDDFDVQKSGQGQNVQNEFSWSKNKIKVEDINNEYNDKVVIKQKKARILKTKR